MESLLEQLESQFDDRALSQIGQQLGVDSKTAAAGVQAALPMMLGAMSRQANSSGGAGGLLDLLDRDNDGSVLDDLAGFLGKGIGGGLGGGGGAGASLGAAAGGGGMLDVIFGGKSGKVAGTLGKSAGLDGGSAMKLLAMLAPVVMGVLARQKRQSGIDSGALAKKLGAEQSHIEARMPGAGDLLGSLLDSDGDGSVMDDLAEKGLGVLKSFLGGKR